MPFKKGQVKTGGKVKGTPNKLTKTVKETVLAVFNDLQEDPKANLLTWGKGNPTEFYKIASKLIPNDIKASVEVISPNLPEWMKNETESELPAPESENK